MIVSCESCKSRYKLDDAKVTGRGAKITCPKCKHVFVVFNHAAEAPKPSQNLASRPADDEADDEGPTRIGGPVGRPGAPINALAFGDGGGAPMSPMGASMPLPRSNPTLAVPLPDMRAPESHVVGNAPVYHQPPPAPPAVNTISPGDAPGRVAGLDFRKVGVTTWKVKVRIGLIYDFSDTKTLRKYITDGRVTPADVISHDGKSWKPIGEIPDLDAFFIQTYERLLTERGDAPPPTPRMPESRTPEPVREDPRLEPEPSLYRDPFDDLRTRQRDRASKRGAQANSGAEQPSSSGRRTPILLGILGVLVVGGGLWYANTLGGGTPSPMPAPPLKAEAAKTIRDQEREEIQNKLRDQFADVPVEPDAAVDPSGLLVADPVANDPTVKVLDDGRVVRVKTPNGASTAQSSTGSRTTSGSTSTASPIKTSDASATDYEAIGDGAAKSKDWSGAAKGYQDAVNLDPGNARLLRKLGEAQYKSGQLDAAQASLQAAASKGQKDALKLLGAIAREQGDVSQANALYQQYLATGPRDAADVEKIIREMNGG